jgi:ATP-dependent DNA helicase RecG
VSIVTDQKLENIFRTGETLQDEFKSDRDPLPDRDMVSAVVALANTEGGTIYLGVEDDGTVTGVHKQHKNIQGLSSLIANKTNPPIPVRVELVEYGGKQIACVHVPKSRQLISTSEGLLQRRRLKADGSPENIPFYPHEFAQRLSALGLADLSANNFPSLSTEVFNPIERERLREAINRYGGDTTLSGLADNELEGALGFTANHEGRKCPTLAGLLFLAREDVLRQYVPSHEIAFQVLEGTEVRVNQFFRIPLLHAFEEIERLFNARVTENEIQVGLFRVPIPSFERRSFREALVNALIHRDYSMLGAVHVRINDEGLTISNPGGFVEGVNLENLLVIEPRPRNPLLADVTKRIGLAERTGRGIDTIFEGLLRYGRPAPDYSRSDSHSVVVRMSNAESDVDFLEMILRDEERTNRRMPLDSLIILSRLRQERRLTTADIAPSVQRPEQEVRSALEKLVEAGLVEAHGTGRGRTYTLSADVYQKDGKKADYIRQTGFDPIQQEQMILNYIDSHGSIKRADASELCRISLYQATRLLKNLVKKGEIVSKGQGKGTFYERYT